jgi:hypothetical protein
MKQLYDLIEHRKGKQRVLMTDSYANVRARLKQLKTSHRGGMGMITKTRVNYTIVESGDQTKFYQKPHNPNLGG